MTSMDNAEEMTTTTRGWTRKMGGFSVLFLAFGTVKVPASRARGMGLDGLGIRDMRLQLMV